MDVGGVGCESSALNNMKAAFRENDVDAEILA